MARMALVIGVLLGAIAGCSFDVDPDGDRFSCKRDVDCGAGFECIAQKNRASGLCFPVGSCANAEEACDGRDEDCNGVVDDVSWAGAPCETNLPGVCHSGTRACEAGNSTCVASLSASPELCDGLDNDCDGIVDEDFDLASDVRNCGACGIACAAGTACSAGTCVESDCANGLDDDGDGAADCADSDCLGQPCSAELVCGRVPSSWLADGGSDPDGGSHPDAGLEDGGLGDAGLDDAGVDLADAGEELVGACVPHENTCDDQLDNDGDGLIDCEDPDCSGLTCGDAGVCSDGICL